MKHLARYLLLISILLNGAMFCFAQGSKESSEPPPAPSNGYNPETWKEFSSAEGRFSVLFPGIPEEATRHLSPPNENITLHSYYLRTSGEYQTSYLDYPFPVEGTDKVSTFLNNVRDSGVKGVNGKLLEDREFAFNGHSGRIYKVEFGGGYLITCRMFVVKNRLYMVVATTYGTKAPADVAHLFENSAAKFLDSFKLLTDQPSTEQAADKSAMTNSASVKPGEGEVDKFLKQNEGKDVVFVQCLEPGRCGAGKIINKPQPRYPAIARAARQQGVVLIAIIVDEEGKVIAAQVQSGAPLLRVAALDAARAMLFSPTYLNGKPVKVAGVIAFNFTLP